MHNVKLNNSLKKKKKKKKKDNGKKTNQTARRGKTIKGKDKPKIF